MASCMELNVSLLDKPLCAYDIAEDMVLVTTAERLAWLNAPEAGLAFLRRHGYVSLGEDSVVLWASFDDTWRLVSIEKGSTHHALLMREVLQGNVVAPWSFWYNYPVMYDAESAPFTFSDLLAEPLPLEASIEITGLFLFLGEMLGEDEIFELFELFNVSLKTGAFP